MRVPGGPAVATSRLRTAAAGVVPLALISALWLAPPDAVQGQSQRLMYVHVPAAWVAYACFAVVVVGSIIHLVTGSTGWDALARAAAELGVGLTALTIVVGSIWGRATWGVWWAWDARLMTTLALLAVYVGYLVLRRLAPDRETGARRSAVLGVLGFALVPVVHFSVVWWRTLHQPPTILSPDPHTPIAGSMAATLAVSVLAFTLLAAWVVLRRWVALTARQTTVASTHRPQRQVQETRR
jgi:heme exporter protein C